MKYKKQLRHKERGFTLLEVLIAMVIFTVGILGTIAMQYTVVAGNTSGNVMNQEMMLAQRILEEKKNGTDVTAIDNNLPADIDPGPYNVNISVTNPVGGATRFITVTVDRPGGIGGHAVTVQTLTMGYGI